MFWKVPGARYFRRIAVQILVLAQGVLHGIKYSIQWERILILSLIFLFEGKAMEKPIFSIQWHITTNCQQRCRHCYLFNSPEARNEIEGEKRITLEMLMKIADNLVESCKILGAIPRATITGGDPLLHKHFWELLEYMQKLSIKVHIAGNPFEISESVAKRLLRLGVSRYQLSLDGMENFHDSFRKQGSFSTTVRACEILQKNGIGVSIMSTASKSNAKEIPLLIKYVAKEMKADVYSFARYCPTIDDRNNIFSPEEYRNFLSNIWDVFCRFNNTGTRFVLKDHLWNLFLMEKGLFSPQQTNGIIVDGCGLGSSHLSVLADGTVYACRRFYSPVGKVPEQNFSDILINSLMDQYRDFSQLVKCKDCELLYYCRGCSAVTYGVTGDWTAPDPQCWK